MTPEQQFRDWLKRSCRALAIKRAILRERYIGNEEKLTDPVAQYQTAMLLTRIRAEWRAERGEAGL